jgi:hypothetical protein
MTTLANRDPIRPLGYDSRGFIQTDTRIRGSLCHRRALIEVERERSKLWPAQLATYAKFECGTRIIQKINYGRDLVMN